MFVTIVHHAEAIDASDDAARPLSARGRAQAESLARAASAHGVKPALIWHSGKLRARQTGEAFWRLCNPFADFRMVKGLRPEDAPEIARTRVDLEERDLLLVSHMPLVPALARALAPGLDGFPVNGLVMFERVEGRYVERWRQSPEG
jgi:phosphohistidine phosphatase